MGKISDYAQALKSKLTDLFVVYQINNSELETKSVTTEQIGDAICGEQVHADLETDDKTIIGGINELAKDKNIADEYDDTHTYNTGDITIHENTLYICQDDNVTGAWDSTKWTATTIDDLIPKTDNNLPHYTGTPTAGSTAEAIGAKQDKLTVTDNTQTVATYGGTIAYRKYGKVVEVTGSSIGTSTNIPINTEPTLYTLPSGYRPKRQITVAGFRQNSYKYDRVLGYTVKTNGEITVYAYDAINNGSFSVCYIVD